MKKFKVANTAKVKRGIRSLLDHLASSLKSTRGDIYDHPIFRTLNSNQQKEVLRAIEFLDERASPPNLWPRADQASEAGCKEQADSGNHDEDGA